MKHTDHLQLFSHLLTFCPLTGQIKTLLYEETKTFRREKLQLPDFN